MALTRKLLKGMGLTDEQVDTIIEAHTETVDGLKEQVNTYKADAAKVPGLEKKLREAENSGGEDWKSLIWVGDTSKGAAMIVLKNALNTAGASITFADKGEGTLPFTFVAHQDNVDDYDVAPAEILFFTNPAAAAASETAAEEPAASE